MVKARWFGFLAALFLALVFGASGCTEKVEMRQVDTTGGTSQADRDTIQKNLDTAGVKGEIVNIVDGGENWIVDVGAPKPPPGKRAAPTMPVTYLVDKK